MEATRHDTTLWQDLRALSSQYWILFGGTLVNRFGNFVMPFMAIYLRHEGEVGHAYYEKWQIGLVLSTYGAGSLLAGVLGGYLTDRIGRRATMILSCFGGGVLMLLLSQARGMPALMSCIFMTALLTSLYGPASSAFIADIVPPRLRIRAFSCLRMAVNTGFAAGTAAAGFMMTYSFASLFIGDAVTTLAMGFAAWFGLKSIPRPPSLNNSWAHALGHMKANRPFQLSVIASFLVAFTFTQISSSYGLQATEGLKKHRLEQMAAVSLSPAPTAAETGVAAASTPKVAEVPSTSMEKGTVYGYLLSLNGLLVVFFELPLTSFTRRFSPPRMIAVGYALVGLGLGLNGFGATIPLLVASMFILTIGEIMALPVSNSYLAGLAPDDMRGRYQGVISMTWSSATLIGPSIGLAVYQISPLFLWIAVGVIGCLAGAIMLTIKWKAPAPVVADRV